MMIYTIGSIKNETELAFHKAPADACVQDQCEKIYQRLLIVKIEFIFKCLSVHYYFDRSSIRCAISLPASGFPSFLQASLICEIFLLSLNK